MVLIFTFLYVPTLTVHVCGLTDSLIKKMQKFILKPVCSKICTLEYFSLS